MKDRNQAQFKLNNELLAKLGVVDTLPMKQKYLISGQYKNGGKKRNASSSGNAGRAYQRKRRAIVVSQNSSPEQFMTWQRANAKNTKDERGAQKLSGESK